MHVHTYIQEYVQISQILHPQAELPGFLAGSPLCAVAGLFRHAGDGPVHRDWQKEPDQAGQGLVRHPIFGVGHAREALGGDQKQKVNSDENLNDMCIMQMVADHPTLVRLVDVFVAGQTQKMVLEV